MIFTEYGKSLAAAEALPTTTATGATAHAEATRYDSGLSIVLTGRTYAGKPFRRTARSVFGAYATAQALGGIERAWDVTADGTRRLVFRR